MSGRMVVSMLGACVLSLLPLRSAGAQAATLDVDLVGGGFNDVTTIALQGDPLRKYLLLVSVVNVPNANFIPNVTTDVGIEFLSLSLSLPGFVGTFNGAGNASATLVVPFIAQLNVFPLYLQLFEAVDGGNKLEKKSAVQTWTLQAKNSFKAPLLGASYSVARSTHTLTLLPDETVLTLGGGSDGITTSYGQASGESYDLRNEKLTVLPQQMLQARTGHSATLLNDGRVLIVGGADDVLGEPTSTAEVYNPATGLFSAVGNLVGGPRALHQATLLDDGRVLITGGTDNYISPSDIILGSYRSTELFNPVTNTFSAGPNLAIARLGQTATKLANGNVLVAGGYSKFLVLPYISGTAEIYNYSAGNPGSFGAQMNMNSTRFGHAAVRLANGDVLLVGGANGSDPFDPQPELSWELYKPGLGFPATDVLNEGRILPTANVLKDGRVLIAGGAKGTFTSPISVQTTEIWDPVTQIASPAAPMLKDRAGHQALTLPDGTVLLSGGGSGDGVFQQGLASLEIYQP